MGETDFGLIITASTFACEAGRSSIGQVGVGKLAGRQRTFFVPRRPDRSILAHTCYGPAWRPVGARRQTARLVLEAEWPGHCVLALQLQDGNENKWLGAEAMRCGPNVPPEFSGQFGALPQVRAKGIPRSG